MVSHRNAVVLLSCSILLLTPVIVPGQTTWNYIPFNQWSALVLTDPSVVYDSTANMFRMWYTDPGNASIVRYGVSQDGIQWYMRDSIVFEGGGIQDFDRFIHGVCVVRHKGEYLMLYTASKANDTLVMGAARSADGLHWTRIGNGAVLEPEGQTGAWECRHVAGGRVLSFGDSLYMWYGGGDGTNMHTGMAVSGDGVTWKRRGVGPVLACGPSGSWDAREATIAGITVMGEKYFMIYRAIDDHGTRSYALATSLDGMQWWKYPDRPVVQGKGWNTFLGSGTLLWHDNGFRLWHTSNYDGSSFWYLRTAISEPVVLSAGSDPTLHPASFALEQNYPNPFNPATVIRANVPSDGKVTIAVYDVLGQAVDVLLDEVRPAGTFEVSFNGSGRASGMYFCRLTAGGMTATKKMMLAK